MLKIDEWEMKPVVKKAKYLYSFRDESLKSIFVLRLIEYMK